MIFIIKNDIIKIDISIYLLDFIVEKEDKKMKRKRLHKIVIHTGKERFSVSSHHNDDAKMNKLYNWIHKYDYKFHEIDQTYDPTVKSSKGEHFKVHLKRRSDHYVIVTLLERLGLITDDHND